MNTALLIATGIIGALATFYVNTTLKQGAVRASALLSFIVALFFYCFPTLLNETLTSKIPIVFIGASFIGMVSEKVVRNYLVIAVSGFIFTLIFLNTSTFFAGYGGALGTSACISLLTAMSISLLTPRKLKNNFITSFAKSIFNKKST
ncbi:hypothetical protein [Neptunitalea lumnitzerae]|uniref:Uncharacterized protein n=1 Tax=Neptunitalea lumnitzerae TaxID=2965509 RepID=A0ABQ5ML81_9FLAO|nr:hypothetical protein [Neptunitalea sp. Y10]GLB50173.1 hypothetical protein Y10_25410 [Neptunitalea sp. Y10]